MADDPTPKSHNHHRSRGIPSDYFYLVLAALGLLQTPATFESSGIWIGILYVAAILCFTYLIADGNKERFTPWLDRSHRS